MITDDNQNGNYLVELFALKRRVVTFQTRTFDDAVEEAWKVYHHRQLNTNTQTRKVTVCRIWKRPGRGWTVTDAQDITQQLRQRWDAEL